MATDGRSYQELLYTPAIIVASVTAVLYLIGYLYYVAFFNRLSIPYGSIDLSVSQCITAALLPISSLIVGVMAFFIFNSPKFKNKFEGTTVRIVSLLILIFLINMIFVNRQMLILSYIIVIILLITFVLLFFLFIISFFPKLLSFFLALTVFILFQTPNNISTEGDLSGVVVLFKLLVCVWIVVETYIDIKSTESEILSNINKISDTNFLPTFLILVLFAFCCSSTLMGIQNADDVVEGVSADALKVNISLTDVNSTIFENKTLILVMLRDDHYYIIEENRNRTKKPKLHIIPNDQIKMVTVYEKGKGPIIDLITN